ncbi:MAG: MerR family DNA-binding protein, partial [Pseudomonadota bacterium]
VGLIAPARHGNGYRDYSAEDLDHLRFVARARGLGFSLDDCRALLGLRRDPGRASADVKALAQARLAEIDARRAELEEMRAALAPLAEACAGDARPHCPILDGLGAASAARGAG